jgi:hypothetical protein
LIYPGLATALAAMEWEQATTNALDDLRLIMTKGQSNSPENRFFTLSGKSPLEARLGPEEAVGGEPLYFDKIEADGWEVRFVATAGNSGNVVYQQPFTVYYRLYYLEPAPEGASVLPS